MLQYETIKYRIQQRNGRYDSEKKEFAFDSLERNFCNKRYEKYLFTYFLLKVFQKAFVRGLCKLFVEV
jgi:hypothetical protein